MIEGLELLGTFKDVDNTIKKVFKAENKGIIEISLLQNREERDVVCVPSHYFCKLGCKICHLTSFEYKNRTKSIEQDVLKHCISWTLGGDSMRGGHKSDKRQLLISFMGMGELVLSPNAIDILKDLQQFAKHVLGYWDVSFAMATMMPDKLKFEQFMSDIVYLKIPLKVHFSMHTPFDEGRFKLLPATRVTIKETMKMLELYRTFISHPEIINTYRKFHTTADGSEIHYTLIKDVNDSDEELHELIDILKTYQIPIKFITFNPVDDMQPSEKLEGWVSTIKSECPKLKVKIYTPPGRNVGASCGQFTEFFYNPNPPKDIFNKWRYEYEIFDESKEYYKEQIKQTVTGLLYDICKNLMKVKRFHELDWLVETNQIDDDTYNSIIDTNPENYIIDKSYIPTPIEAHALKIIRDKFERREILIDGENILQVLNIDENYYRRQLDKIQL